jgi:spore coat protein U-like protein
MSSRAWSNMPVGLIAGAGLLLAAAPAAAQLQSEKLTVQARIGEACSVTSASLDFGQEVDLDVNNNAVGAIEISCAASTTFSVALDGGLNFQPITGSRTLAGTGGSISYGLYKDTNRTTPWGVGESVPATIDGEGSVPVYGQVPSQSNGHDPGLYTDEVMITLVF